MPIDYVTTFVDGSDTNWKRLYIRTFGRAPEMQRYRNYDTLKYAFRGIDECMPWIRYVFLIVQNESQIPKWLDRNNPKIKIVSHEDFIPKEFLPTFNSNVIEMFINRIPELSEHFILANDDMIPTKKMEPTRFYRDGKPVEKVLVRDKNMQKPFDKKVFDYIVFNTVKLAAKAAGLRNNFWYRDWHLLIPHLKSSWDYIWKNFGNEIKIGLLNSRKRTRRNHNHWVFRYFNMNTGRYVDDQSIDTNGYMLVKDDTTAENVKEKIYGNDVVCFNDGVKNNTSVYDRVKEVLNTRFPNKCSFEIK